MRQRTWTQEQLKNAVINSLSCRQVLTKLNLKPTGGNYRQLSKYVQESNLNTSHFKGHAWNKGLKYTGKPLQSLEKILVENSDYQSYKLKLRLFINGYKKERCEICGWAEKSIDGRIPLELDHINGNHLDNRITNLQILCPNCHSLRPSHGGRNRCNRLQ